ncbi:MAG: hypothetical protein ACI9BW_001494 [Gammaproteobacteria bacterium]|jgi:uncharacterized protein YgfB (UPF0149 family)
MVEKSDSSLYEAVDTALGTLNSDIGAAECHGMLCGMTCGLEHLDPSLWLGHVIGYREPLSRDDLGPGHALAQLFDETLAEFAADDFSLQILLPSDETSFAIRTEALGAWCRGFLSGFGLGDLQDTGSLSEDCQGFLRDLQEIGRVDSLDSDDEVDELALLEVCEYTRMGAMLLREEALFSNSTNQDAGTIH